MIDVHCHFDLAQDPEKYISYNEKRKIVTIGMTNLPSHFMLGVNHVKKYNYIRLALGLHPLRANEHVEEYSNFKKCISETSYIGEVGLDFSQEGIVTKEIQINSFDFVLDCIKGKPKVLSLHSRNAEKELFQMLITKKIENAIFHWYSGSLSTLDKIVDMGFFFSINSAMIQSNKGKKIIAKIPKELILTETDFPYIDNTSIPNIHFYLSYLWQISNIDVEKIINSNFKRLIQRLK